MGKSTLLKTVMGIISPTSGTILYSGQDVTRLKPGPRAQYGMGYVPQGRGIFPNLSVLDNLRMGVVGHGLDEEDAIRDIILDFPRLETLLDRSGGTLSGGEQQILALARCLISQPDLILLDEPTEGIQPSIVDEIGEILNTLNRKKGVTIVLVEQNMEFITELSHRIKIMEKGCFAGEVDMISGHGKDLLQGFSGFGGSKKQRLSHSISEPTSPKTPEPMQKVTAAEKSPTQPTAASFIDAPLTERIVKMTVQRPTFTQLKEITLELGMQLSDEQINEFLSLIHI